MAKKPRKRSRQNRAWIVSMALVLVLYSDEKGPPVRGPCSRFHDRLTADGIVPSPVAFWKFGKNPPAGRGAKKTLQPG